MINLKNKNIIVTGASGGIGNSIVEQLCKVEANVLATGTKIEKLNNLLKDGILTQEEFEKAKKKLLDN